MAKRIKEIESVIETENNTTESPIVEVGVQESETLQKQGYEVIEMYIKDGEFKHKLKKLED